MFKKIIASTISFTLLLVSLNTISTFASTSPPSKTVSITEASWNDSYSSLDNMQSDSDLIIIGTVVSAETELRYDMVFTKSYIRIEKQIKGSFDSDSLIPVIQTGGKYGNITTPEITDAPVLKVGDVYELYLSVTDNSEKYGVYYLIAGGYQGVLKIDNGNKYVMSESNTLFNNASDIRAIDSNTPTKWTVPPTELI